MRFCILIGVPILIGETCFIFLAFGAGELNLHHFCNKTRCTYEPSADYADCKNKDLNKIPPQCSSAEYLDLRKNDLQNIGYEKTSLSKFKKLKYLYLDGNQIRNITPRAFAECGSLQQLYLQNNPIVMIRSEALSGLTDLRQLYLNLAQLQVIQSHAFDDLTALLRLFLSDNSLVTLPSDLFQELQNLEILTLANNNLRSLASDTFQGLIRLQYLDIKQNSLTILPNGLFNNMLILNRLTLSYNAIHTIEKGAIDFDHLFNLETLDMRNNSITSIANFSTEILSISNIHLSYNPLNCSCNDINGLLVWYELHSKVTTMVGELATCTTPLAFAGMLVRDIMANSGLTCDKIIDQLPVNDQPPNARLVGSFGSLDDIATTPEHNINHPSKTNGGVIPNLVTVPTNNGFIPDLVTLATNDGVIPDLVTYTSPMTNNGFQNETEISARKNPKDSKNTILMFGAIAILTATTVIVIIIIILIIVKCRRDQKREHSNSTNHNHQANERLYDQVRSSESTISTNLGSLPSTPASPNNDSESFPLFQQTSSSNPTSYVPHSAMHTHSTHPNPTNHNAQGQIPDVLYVTNNPYAVHIQPTNVDQSQQIHPNFDTIAHNPPASTHQTDLPSPAIPYHSTYPQIDLPNPPIPLPDVQLNDCRCSIPHLPNNNPFCAQAQNNMMHIHNNPICA